MGVTFKLRVEALEDRMALSASGLAPVEPPSSSEPARQVPVLMVIANQNDFQVDQKGAGNLAVTAPTVSESDKTYYVGTANGGVWKTTDGGAGDFDPVVATWYLQNSNSPGAPDTSRPGVGVLKSTDSGATWTL
jgi:hypothetical protein